MANFSELDRYLFGQATHYEIYRKLGAHPTDEYGIRGVCFDLWAPNAARVWVIGSFNGWDEGANEMKCLEPQTMGIFELFIPGVEEGDLYKYLIETKDGKRLYKADPYANYAELRPGTASAVADIEHFKWSDAEWMKERATHKEDVYEQPLAIYEVHPGSWMRHPGRQDDGFYSYRDLAKSLIPYVIEMGYSHIELMGICEYPYDGSWGYQVTGYYAPTSRYGTPEDFAYFVNECHRHKIGVILDWVPAHFPKDAHGLAEFDGSCLYEYADPRKGEHPDWGTKIFDYGKNEVKNFLIGSALLWVEHYHVDGLRVDAVASMLYLDYGKEAGQWVPNQYGDNKNLEAIEFFKHINTLVLGRNPGAVMIAEESTAWPKVTGSVEDDGLNFSYKWNMGWMHDFLDYMKLDPYFRRDNHHKMTFAMSYNESEKYILVLSHDEVVHLKCSMINKMPGLGIDKFRNLMAGYAFMMGHPGKKLLFMGQEFAQLREWSEERELDWFLLDNPDHKHIQNWVKKLLHIYRKNPALYELDSSWGGFEWINANDADRSIYSFIRKSKDGKNQLLFVCSFTPVARPDYRVGVPVKKSYKLILDSDSEEFGGCGRQRPQSYKAVESECDGRPYSIAYPLEPYGVAVFRF
ncbi:1,4-alpha-glucan branching protein GlgB [Roseburia hominis]|uniref:1,4-alpha-glucan branching protein GlgB n=1 Tax=Roseburia hominis TaxID=301301 RepID=UPI0026F304B0|nr:1,4-alpha-glucan branching protein GlgB [Roseburia hominis]MCI7522560.1 1,4-alpha-glucan branching protein GlgB [Roseburia hominis]